MVLLAFGSWKLWVRQDSWKEMIFWSALILGLGLRYRYYLATPEMVRANDFNGHMAYINYVLQHWNIPPSIKGWEFHQPPFYYFFVAAFVHASSIVSPEVTVQAAGGLAALLLSWISLVLGLQLLSEVFSNEHRSFALSAFALAVFPSLVFFSTRITNDSLLHAGVFLWLLLAYREWRHPKKSRLLLLLTFLSAALTLVKLTGALYFILLLLFLALRRWKMAERLRLAGVMCLIFVACTAWYPTYRVTHETNVRRLTSVGNSFMSKRLQLRPLHAEQLLTFSPLRVVGIPFNDAWSDAFGRQYFWEYAFRSAFFGEFKFSAVRTSSFLLLLAMGLLPFLFYGLWKGRGEKEYLPFVVASLVLIGSVLAYRLTFAFSSNQDLRYVAPVFLPLIILTVYGIHRSCGKWQLAGTAAACVFLISSLVFDLLI